MTFRVKKFFYFTEKQIIKSGQTLKNSFTYLKMPRIAKNTQIKY